MITVSVGKQKLSVSPISGQDLIPLLPVPAVDASSVWGEPQVDLTVQGGYVLGTFTASSSSPTAPSASHVTLFGVDLGAEAVFEYTASTCSRQSIALVVFSWSDRLQKTLFLGKTGMTKADLNGESHAQPELHGVGFGRKIGLVLYSPSTNWYTKVQRLNAELGVKILQN